MKKLYVIILIALAPCLQPANAQIPDDTDGRLYRLCKTWGYFKYFNQHQCELKWDTLLNTTINQVLAANSNEEFNAALMTMFNKVGNNTNLGTQYPDPDTNFNFDDSWIDDPVFSTEVQDFLETFSSNIYPDTSTCLVKFNDYETPGYYSYIDFRGDPQSMIINLSSEANILTYMFYYWNVINYFFPYRNLMDQPWDSTLAEFIPLFRQVETILDLHVTFLKLVTKINDTHGATSSSILMNNFWGGYFLPQIFFTWVDSSCVVTKVEGIDGVSRGDILTALKGIPMEEIEDSLSHFIPASNQSAFHRDLYYRMMLGAQNSTFDMTLTDMFNNSYTVTVTRSMSNSTWYTWSNDPGHTDSYFMTDCNYGYVDMGLLLSEEVPAMYEMMKDAPAIIFDIRNYPNGTLWDLGYYLFPEPIISAIYYNPALTDLYPPPYYYKPGWYYAGNDFYNLGIWFNPEAYDGNVYILVNEETQSQAEYTCQYFSFHPNATVFGTQTAGADGNVSSLTLQGGIYTYFTSLGWYYGDGYQQQRNGVRIDTIVSPTITGIRDGKDEILLAALDCLTNVKEQRAEGIGLSVYPNPASRHLTVGQSAVGGQQSAASGQQSAIGSRQTAVRLSIVDLFGREVKAIANVSSFPFQLDISSLPDGVYILKMTDESGNTGSTKFIKIR